MYPTLLDVKTGRSVEAKDNDNSVFWWAEGDGSCDCNRALFMGEEIHDDIQKDFSPNTCFGCFRIVATDVHGDLEGWSKQELLQELNREYPKELDSYWKNAIE